MWFAVIEGLGNALAAYRVMQDAGMWLVQLHAEDFQHYMESHLISKGRL